MINDPESIIQGGFHKKPIFTNSHQQGRIWRAFRAFPGRPWRRTQDSVGHKTDDKRDRKKERNEWEKGKMCKEKNN